LLVVPVARLLQGRDLLVAGALIGGVRGGPARAVGPLSLGAQRGLSPLAVLGQQFQGVAGDLEDAGDAVGGAVDDGAGVQLVDLGGVQRAGRDQGPLGVDVLLVVAVAVLLGGLNLLDTLALHLVLGGADAACDIGVAQHAAQGGGELLGLGFDLLESAVDVLEQPHNGFTGIDDGAGGGLEDAVLEVPGLGDQVLEVLTALGITLTQFRDLRLGQVAFIVGEVGGCWGPGGARRLRWLQRWCGDVLLLDLSVVAAGEVGFQVRRGTQRGQLLGEVADAAGGGVLEAGLDPAVQFSQRQIAEIQGDVDRDLTLGQGLTELAVGRGQEVLVALLQVLGADLAGLGGCVEPVQVLDGLSGDVAQLGRRIAQTLGGVLVSALGALVDLGLQLPEGGNDLGDNSVGVRFELENALSVSHGRSPLEMRG
jgi:hypothetical protein